MIQAVKTNKLGHAAPALTGKCLFPTEKPHVGFGRFTNFIEFHFDLLTREMFACLQDVVSKPPLNHHGLGVDHALPYVCPGNRGIIDVMRKEKVSHGSYDAQLAWGERQGWLAAHHFKHVDGMISWGPLQGEILSCDPQDGSCAGLPPNFVDCPSPRQVVWEHSTITTTTTLFSLEEQAAWETERHRWSGTRSRIGMQFIVPISALVCAFCLSTMEKYKVLGKLFYFFAAQTLMGLYMKMVLSKSVVSEEDHMQGFPAAFLVTGLQQITSFVLLMILLLLSQVTPWRYCPKALTTRKEYGMLFVFSLCFALNIGLNNLSLTMLDVSTNQIIRSFAPLTTLIAQCVFSKITGIESKDVKPTRLALMLVGSISGIVAVIAKGMSVGIGTGTSETDRLVLGVVICLFSLFFASMELMLVSVLGGSLALNPIDTVAYMAVPCTLFLSIPASFVANEVSWPGYSAPMTDMAIAREVIRLSPMTFLFAVLSGALALAYNILVYTVVQKLSASTLAFASTFNKFSTISLALIFGFELLPSNSGLSIIMLIGIAGNLGSFAVSSWIIYFRPQWDWSKVESREVERQAAPSAKIEPI
jgi:hypothetical protein